ncbi:MAG TPA: hypothetical protein PKL97_02765 [Candidatus Omnitrophota bacterium]|nr:hypothetical protein [Candidatus Omnitrophota bacterium]
MMKKIFFPIVLWAVLVPAPLKAEEPSAPSQQAFEEAVRTVSQRLQGAALKRSFRFKFMNDSLEKTAQAARAMASQENPERIASLLKSARGNYPDNFFAILLDAILTESRGGPQRANRLFETFWDKSAVLTDFEKSFMTPEELNTLRKTVYLLLRSRGVTPKSPKEKAAETQRLLFWAAGLASFLLFFPILSRLNRFLEERFKPVAKGYRRCPRCRAVLEELFTECPSCRRKI